MLNTKPIKKKLDEFAYEKELKLSDDNIPAQTARVSDKIVQLESSKQKELENLVKSANNDSKVRANSSDEQIVIPNDNDVIKEFTNDRYKDPNLKVSGIIEGNKIIMSNFEKNNFDKGYFEHVNIINIPNPIKNIAQRQHIEWDSNDNCFKFSNADD